MKKSAISAACALVAGAALAHSGATGIVKERMDGMKAMSNATKALGAIKLEVIPYSPETIRRAAGELRLHGEAARAQFPEGSIKGMSEALPVIFEDRAKFDALMEELIAASIRLDAAAEDPERAMQVADEVGATCKDCHEVFRKKKL